MSSPPSSARSIGPVGIIVAIDEERAGFSAMFAETERHDIAGRTFRCGRLNDVAVIVVRAGIGKVNAALASTLLCQHFGCRALALSGVAGAIAPGLQLGDAVVADRLVCYDYGAQVDGAFQAYQPGTPPLPTIRSSPGYEIDPALLTRVRDSVTGMVLPILPGRSEAIPPPRLLVGPILSGDTLVNCAAMRASLYTQFGGLVVEMEGAAMAQVARRFRVPALVVRAVSDLAGGVPGQDFRPHLAGASLTAATVLIRLVTHL
ncbi:MAG: 5'-methylthioadenosine/S-adenosylhomocysteine nucleosidase [Alphaproteobacteria bacterium]|jgi:adenosylhomocysteine nucleosidase|nr:5'-methylthioadenosine/S-adenosylhomocysteine nucleosidase [Alphaproteobacteria bacterium]